MSAPASQSVASTSSRAWTLRLGGPVNRHGRPGGVWFDPVPWSLGAAILTWCILMLRQIPCMQTVAGQPVDSFIRLCYSDIAVLYQSRGIWQGGPIFADQNSLEYPVLTGAFIVAARWITGRIGGVVSPMADGQQRLDAANIFFVVNAVLLFCCFLVLVWAHLQMGRDQASVHTDQVRVRSWDALFIAAAPAVWLAGLINWDLLVVALTSLGLLAWARSRPGWAGVCIGLAFAAKFYPVAIVPVLLLLCLRANKWKAFGLFLATTAGTWLLINLPVMLASPQGWAYFWTFNAGRGADLGSLWYMLSLAGFDIPRVDVMASAFTLASGLAITWLVLRAPRRPRLGQVLALVMIAFLAFNKVYSPQYVLWLLPLIVLARPVLLDLFVFTISETLYFLAIWGFLDGILGIGTGADRLYWLSVLLRIGVQGWIAHRIINDILKPWQDPVRLPFVDDPIGGVLDHAPDSPWLWAGRPGRQPAEQ